jgi:hypothetical protein
LTCQEAEGLGADRALLHLAPAGQGGPKAGKAKQRSRLVNCEPSLHHLAPTVSYSAKDVNGTMPSQARQCGLETLRIFVTPGSVLPFSACGGDGIPNRAIASSRPSAVRCFNVATVKSVVNTASFPLTVQSLGPHYSKAGYFGLPMFYEIIGVLLLVFCAIIFVAHAIDAFRFRRPSTFKYSSGAPVPRNTTGKQKP